MTPGLLDTTVKQVASKFIRPNIIIFILLLQFIHYYWYSFATCLRKGCVYKGKDIAVSEDGFSRPPKPKRNRDTENEILVADESPYVGWAPRSALVEQRTIGFSLKIKNYHFRQPLFWG